MCETVGGGYSVSALPHVSPGHLADACKPFFATRQTPMDARLYLPTKTFSGMPRVTLGHMAAPVTLYMQWMILLNFDIHYYRLFYEKLSCKHITSGNRYRKGRNSYESSILIENCSVSLTLV